MPIPSTRSGHDERVVERRRIGFRESFKAAAKADESGGGDAGMWATLVTAVWFWVRGVPVNPQGRADDT